MTQQLELIIGNRNYSSWSLRGWLAMRHTKLAFEEIFIPLSQPQSSEMLAQHSPSRLVPALKIDGNVVWDSLAIIETLNELAPDAGMWPAGMLARAIARSVSAEIHAGFFRLRRDMPMDLRTLRPGQQHTEGALADAKRIQMLWADCRRQFAGSDPFLFGEWTAADIMYAPVVGRFRTYDVPADAETQAYMDAVWTHPDMAARIAAAEKEPYEIKLF